MLQGEEVTTSASTTCLGEPARHLSFWAEGRKYRKSTHDCDLYIVQEERIIRSLHDTLVKEAKRTQLVFCCKLLASLDDHLHVIDHDLCLLYVDVRIATLGDEISSEGVVCSLLRD